MHNFLPRLTGVFALFRKTGTTENVPFPSMLCTTLLTDTHNTSNFLPGHRQTILHYQNDQLYAPNMTNTGHKASSYLICTQSAFTMPDMMLSAVSLV